MEGLFEPGPGRERRTLGPATGRHAPRCFTLALLDGPDGLAAALTDGAHLARIAWSARTTRSDAAREAGDGDTGGTEDPARALCTRGARLYALLPDTVRTYLRAATGGAMTLQLAPSLAAWPWEMAFDGEAFLGEKFQLARQLALDAAPSRPPPRAPGRGRLQVAILCGPDVASATDFAEQLRSQDELEVRPPYALEPTASGLSDLLAQVDVVHCMQLGPAAARTLQKVAALDHRPALVVLHGLGAHGRAGADTAPALALLGLNVLACRADASADAATLLRLVYRRLAEGAAIGEAVRSARAGLHRDAGVVRLAALDAVLHGDPVVIACARDRRSHGEDTRRQVTILSFDLVESTRLLAELGAERYSDVLAQYHLRCAAILRARGGAPDDPQGDDGMMCYFGFPEAREDAAAQALRAGLELIEAVQSLGLGVRVGVCTGDVVVRDGQPVGKAIHFAARLQSVAAPGTMVVGDSTRRIVRETFRFQPLHHGGRLKGFDEAERFFRVAGPVDDALPLTAGTAPQPTPFIGREREMQLLHESLAAAQSGRFQLVRVAGEAGIGKSRLVREFRRVLEQRGHEVFECRCAPDHANSAYHPLIEGLRNQLRIHAGEDPAAVLDRLARLVQRSAELDEGALALLADLLGIPTATRHPVLAQSPERRRQLTMDLLATLAQLRLLDRAACMIVEDVHWVDPSTGEFLNHLAATANDRPLLMIITTRPDAELRWYARHAGRDIVLGGLSPAQSRALVLAAGASARLPSTTVQQIAARADGVPLFIEESTRMAVELAETRAPTLDPALVPSTILDLLTARLDRLGGARHVAQAGGAIGREFTLALLSAVLSHPDSPLPPLDLATRLGLLVRAGMLVVREDGDGQRYAFRHALMRDAAYRSLLERDRARLHRVIAQVMVEQFGSLAERQPGWLAYHHGEAGNVAEAVRCWELAARQAASRSAHCEAIGHVGQALDALPRLPPGVERERTELRLQLLLATRLIATDGYGADRVERAYARALQIATATDDEGALMKILLGLEGYHFMRADFAKARAYALDAARRAAAAGPIQAIQVQWAIANIRMHQGDMLQAVCEMDACRAAFDGLEHRAAAVQDPGVMCLCYSAWSLWQLGQPDEALRRVTEVVERAERLQHPFSLGEAFGFRAAVQHFRGDDAAALASAEQAIRICEEGGFAVWLAHARVMRGRALAELGDPPAGIEEMRQAYDAWSASGAVVTTPFYLAMRAEGLSLGDRPEEGLALAQEALAVVERCGERYYEPEIRRLHGTLTLQIAARAKLDRREEAERWLLDALACARALQMRSLALRSALSLAELWLDDHRPAAAAELLEAALHAIDGGRDTRDPVRARTMLARAMGTRATA